MAMMMRRRTNIPPPIDREIDRLGELGISLWQTHGDITASVRCFQAIREFDELHWATWHSLIHRVVLWNLGCILAQIGYCRQAGEVLELISK